VIEKLDFKNISIFVPDFNEESAWKLLKEKLQQLTKKTFLTMVGFPENEEFYSINWLLLGTELEQKDPELKKIADFFKTKFGSRKTNKGADTTIKMTFLHPGYKFLWLQSICK